MLTTLSTSLQNKLRKYKNINSLGKKIKSDYKTWNLVKYLPHLSCFTMWCDMQALMPLWNGEGVSSVGLSQKCIRMLKFARVQNMLRHILEFEF